jgi:2-amino-4-hydroxy-6-hydroxymethyldihydropteridine diphosphokinase
MELHQVYLGLGSNLGDRASMLNQAIDRLRTLAPRGLEVSRIYESPAMGGEDCAPAYLNQVVGFETDLSPEALLFTLKGFERLLGRKERPRWNSREIDLDVLLYDQKIEQLGRYRIPHEGLAVRQFVLRPLCDLCPDRIHPLEKVSMAKMLEGLVHFEGEQTQLWTGN